MIRTTNTTVTMHLVPVIDGVTAFFLLVLLLLLVGSCAVLCLSSFYFVNREGRSTGIGVLVTLLLLLLLLLLSLLSLLLLLLLLLLLMIPLIRIGLDWIGFKPKI